MQVRQLPMALEPFLTYSTAVKMRPWCLDVLTLYRTSGVVQPLRLCQAIGVW
jgi:hypothetical protein